MTYPSTPGATAGSDTSQAAADAIQTAAKGHCDFLTAFLENRGMFGTTMDEATNAMAHAGFTSLVRNNVSARLGQLCAVGIAFKSTQNRKGGAKGSRPQSVYKLIQYQAYDTKRNDTVKVGKQEISNKWLIWSNEHKAWWKAGSQGYTPLIQQAGVYSYEEASRICYGAGFDELGIPQECMRPFRKEELNND